MTWSDAFRLLASILSTHLLSFQFILFPSLPSPSILASHSLLFSPYSISSVLFLHLHPPTHSSPYPLILPLHSFCILPTQTPHPPSTHPLSTLLTHPPLPPLTLHPSHGRCGVVRAWLLEYPVRALLTKRL